MTSRDPRTLTDEDLAFIADTVKDIRDDAGLGGQCGFVCEVLANRYGWGLLGGVYHSLDGHPIGDHVWCYDPATGLRVDPTADQFGEGAELRIFAEADAVGVRYRHAESEEQEDEWLDMARIRVQREGDYWWVPGGAQAPEVVAYEAAVTRHASALT